MPGKLLSRRSGMQKAKDVWAKKWRELKGLVNKKYENYIALVGLELKQFQETEGTQVNLLIRNHSFILGSGANRLAAINEALRTVRGNRELEPPTVGIFRIVIKDKVLGDKNLDEAVEIIKKCKY